MLTCSTSLIVQPGLLLWSNSRVQQVRRSTWLLLMLVRSTTCDMFQLGRVDGGLYSIPGASALGDSELCHFSLFAPALLN